jgi:NitT/TauT family transport system substrate-binding protein
MEDDLIAFGVRKMKEYEIVTGGDAAKLGIMTMTDARWQRTAEFMAEAQTVKPGLDHRRAYTLEIVREVKVLP